MKAFLMHRDRDFDLELPLPSQADALVQDLELDILLAAMAADDEFLLEVARKSLLLSLNTVDSIRYRQDILRDCLTHPEVIREVYDIAVEAIIAEKRKLSFWSQSADSILSRSVDVLRTFVPLLRRLRSIADKHAVHFRSEGLVRLLGMLSTELSDDYFSTIDDHLGRLRFKHGALMSAELGEGCRGDRYVLRESERRRTSWREKMPGSSRSAYSFQIADRDESGWRALNELRARGINLVANALAQSVDHILSFFKMLRVELGFYIGCMNLCRRLEEYDEPVCFPEPSEPGGLVLTCRGLCDALRRP